MLEDAGPGDRPVLGHVADEHGRQPRRFAASITCAAHSRTWPTDPGAPAMPSACRVWIESTTQTSGRSASIVASTDSSDGLGQRPHRQRGLAEPLGAEPNLGRRLLAGDVERPPPGRDEVAERHPGQRRLADPRRAAEEYERARDEAAAEDPVELGDAGAEARDRRGGDLAERHRAPRGAAAPAAGPPGGGCLGRGLDQRVPLAAAGAAARPAERLVAARLADVSAGGARHRTRLRTPSDAIAPPRPAGGGEPVAVDNPTLVVSRTLSVGLAAYMAANPTLDVASGAPDEGRR